VCLAGEASAATLLYWRYINWQLQLHLHQYMPNPTPNERCVNFRAGKNLRFFRKNFRFLDFLGFLGF